LQTEYYGKNLSSDTAATFVGVINEMPTEKSKFVKCKIKVLQIKSDSSFKNAEGEILCYFKKFKGMSIPKSGETFIIKTDLLTIPDVKNPEQFNYKKYLANKQIFHSCFIDSGSYNKISGRSDLNSLWLLGLQIKQNVLSALKSAGLSPEAYGICAALITGFDDDIDKNVVNAFSHSGTLHVLSVSGLHVGLIYYVLGLIFDFIDRRKKQKLFKFIVISLLLWGFALITGFSAPVLRSVIMFNLLGIGRLFFRNNVKNQINILMASAFFLLFYNPYYITDIGFLLSYFAMFGLFYFQPKIAGIWEPNNYFLRNIWESSTASIAATITTLPITLLIFKQFPIWFVVCNIVVVPATFVLLLLAAIALFKISFITTVINGTVKFLIVFIQFFNSSSIGYVDRIDFDFYDAVLLVSLIITITFFLQKRSFNFAIASLIIIIGWQFYSVYQSFQSKSETLLAVYHTKKKSSYVVKNKSFTFINQIDSLNYDYSIKNHVTSFNNAELKVKEFNMVSFMNDQTFFYTKQNFYPPVNLNTINTLVLCNAVKLPEKDFEKFSGLKLLIADGTTSNYGIKKLQKLCSKFDIKFYNTAASGAYLFNWHETEDRR
jgi:competence protein ComEC